jgi:polysaccharide export outer membrane protein
VNYHLMVAAPAVLVLSAFAMAGQRADEGDKQAGAPRPAPAADVVLGPDDEITIQAMHVEEISGRPFRIDSEGFVGLPLLGRVRLGGLTLEQCEAELRTRLQKVVLHPDVTVSITSLQSRPVWVTGAVNRPGAQQMPGPKTLLQVLTDAGGLRSDANGYARVTREKAWGVLPLPEAVVDPQTGRSTAEVNLKTLFDPQSPLASMELKPHDVISVPVASIVYVIGEVSKPGAFQMSDRQNMTVLQALVMAGGLSKTAAPKSARILRATETKGQRVEVPVNLAQLLGGKQNDVPLVPDDVLLVPENTGKKVANRAIDAAISMGTSILTVGVAYRH